MSLTTDFFASPLEFAKTYSICPPNDIGGYRGKDATTLDTSGYKAIGPSSGNDISRDSVKYSRVMRSKKVGYIKLFNDTSTGEEIRNDEGVGVIRLEAKYHTFGEAEPAYFLPWNSDGAIVKLRLPVKGSGVPDPDIFFTAAINGCSIFIQGDADQPTVYHAGGDTFRKDHNDASRFWRHALQNHIKSSATAQSRGAMSTEVNKTHYVKTPGTQSNMSTPMAEKYEKELKAQLDKKGSFQVTMVNPWGCVFGVRTGNDWAFYLQENSTVICNYVNKKGVRTVKYAKPMRLTKIFPGGSSCIASMSHQVPVKIS